VNAIRRLLALVALVALGVIGLNNLTSWRGAQTGSTRLAVVVAVAAGLLALVGAVAMWRRATWLRAVLLACVVATAAAAGLASWAWGNAPTRGWLVATIVGAGPGAIAAALAWPPRLSGPAHEA